MIRIKELEKVDFQGIPLIQSFSGSGAIGTILSTFLIKALEMKHVATIHSDAVPPVAMIKNGLIEHPIRVFKSDELALMTCEVSIPYGDVAEFLEKLVQFYLAKGVSYIVPVGGLPVLQDPFSINKCYGIAHNSEILGFLEDKGVHLLEEGIVYGTVVETLEICNSEGFNNSFSLLAECDPGVASYDATRMILQNLAKVFDFEFDEEQFERVSDSIRKRIDESARILREETMDKTRESHL